ncbi:MAG: HVO_0416 family zinc finger protein [Halobacteriaceae archaeon]
MASAPDSDDALLDEFLERRGHEPREEWDYSYNKKQCPECGALHDTAAGDCSVCGWAPEF